MQEYRGLRRSAGDGEDFLLIDEGIAQDHPGGREVAEDELVTLLGDRRRRGNVDDEGHALLLGDLRNSAGLAGVERTDQHLCAFADQLLGARAGDVDIGFGVGVDDLERRQAHVLEDAGGDIDAALAVLADAGLIA